MPLVEEIKDTDFRNLDAEIKRTMRYSAKAVVGLGFLLRRMADQKLWAECYDSFDDYLREELHMDYTMASRFIGINKKYSVGGNSAELEPEWAEYSQAALIEMLSMPRELEEKVTPDMTVRQVRELKRQAREARTKLEKETEPVKEKRCDTYPGYICNIGEIVKKHFTKNGNIEGCAGCCAICLKKRGCKYACEAVLAMDVIKLANISEEQAPVIPVREDTGKAPVDKIPDAEYRELDIAEEVATSQPMRSAYGLEKTERPVGSLLTMPGCGRKYYCFSCAQECDIRQEMCYCQTAPLGKPFGCDMVPLIKNLKVNVGDRCQFVNNILAYHTHGTDEAEPCCRECGEDCAYRCKRSRQLRDAVPQESGSSGIPVGNPDDGIVDGPAENPMVENLTEKDAEGDASGEEDQVQLDDLAKVKRLLREEQRKLDDYLKVGGLPEKLMFKHKTIVAALAAMVSELELAEEKAEPGAGAEVEVKGNKEQPELPVFKNDNQRKEWLRAYKDWGLWYRDKNIGAEYYKYDFDNGARLIAEVYPGDYEPHFLHLVGGPKPPKGAYGAPKWARHEKYCKHPNCETDLVEFLKEAQKK